ncbi:hypothetical protein HOY80DRAFT_1057031 [Tuber brumale]|nr:hypothetical protein HOY80DRAFT_1057031 [Tuber brumale]
MGYRCDEGVFGNPHSTKGPRAIRAASLPPSGASTKWALQCNVGQETLDDPVRPPCNEGIFYAERIRAHPPQLWGRQVEDIPLGFNFNIKNVAPTGVELVAKGGGLRSRRRPIACRRTALFGQHEVQCKFEQLNIAPLEMSESGNRPVGSEGLTPGYTEGSRKLTMPTKSDAQLEAIESQESKVLCEDVQISQPNIL